MGAKENNRALRVLIVYVVILVSCFFIYDTIGRIYKQYDILELHELPGNATELPDYYVVNGTYYKMERAEKQNPAPAMYSDDWWASTKGEGMACLFFILLILGLDKRATLHYLRF